MNLPRVERGRRGDELERRARRIEALRSRCSTSAEASPQVPLIFAIFAKPSGWLMRFALYVGDEAIAKTAPVFASIATTAPQRPASCVEREPLDRRAQRQHHVVAVHGLPAELVELCLRRVREVRVRAGQVVVERLLEPGRACRRWSSSRSPAARGRSAGTAASRSSGRFLRLTLSARTVPSAAKILPRSTGAARRAGRRFPAAPRAPAAHVCQYVVATMSTAMRTSATTDRCRSCVFTPTASLAIRSVRDQHQSCHEEEVGDDARPSVRDEGERDARQRDDAEDAADDDERLQREAEAEAGGEELREAVARGERDLEAAQDERHVEQQQRGRADEPELLRDRRVDEVGVLVGDDLRPGRRS